MTVTYKSATMQKFQMLFYWCYNFYVSLSLNHNKVNSLLVFMALSEIKHYQILLYEIRSQCINPSTKQFTTDVL